LPSSFLLHRGYQIHYRLIGSGPLVTACFHGFGEQAAAFEVLVGILPGHRLVAIDLPFHGGTDWQEGEPFGPEDLLKILDGIPETAQGRIGLMGYSMGGRVALSMLEWMPDRISHLVLLAPDGLKVSPWYTLATRTGPGIRLFRWTMHHPGWFRGMARLGATLGLVNASVEKYVERYIDDEKKRQDLFHIWTTLAGFRPSVDDVAGIIRAHQLPTWMVFGRYDRIIPPENGHRLSSLIGLDGRIVLLECGHRILHEHNLSALSTIFHALTPTSRT